MTVRTSQLISDLETSIAAAKDGFTADCLRANLGAQLARLGRVDEGRRLLATLRERYATTSHPRVLPWINFGEAILDLRAGNGAAALMKMRRAHALSLLGSVNQLRALSSAWLANMYWNEDVVEDAARCVEEALEIASEDDHLSRCRANLVVAQFLASSGKRTQAESWFARARFHAISAGDDASRSALGFNIASAQLTALKQLTFERREVAGSSRAAVLQNEISRTLDELLNIPSDDLSVLQHAQVLSLQNNPAAALDAYEKLRGTTLNSRERRLGEWLSDQAWCFARLGRTTEARATADAAASAVVAKTQLDDLACMHSRLFLTYDLIKEPEMAMQQEEIARELWSQHRVVQARWAELCQPLVARFDTTSSA